MIQIIDIENKWKRKTEQIYINDFFLFPLLYSRSVEAHFIPLWLSFTHFPSMSLFFMLFILEKLVPQKNTNIIKIEKSFLCKLRSLIFFSILYKWETSWTDAVKTVAERRRSKNWSEKKNKFNDMTSRMRASNGFNYFYINFFCRLLFFVIIFFYKKNPISLSSCCCNTERDTYMTYNEPQFINNFFCVCGEESKKQKISRKFCFVECGLMGIQCAWNFFLLTSYF